MNRLNDLPKPFFILAPMDDVADTVFRQIVADCAKPDLFFTEFVNVDGLQSVGRDNLLDKLQFTLKEAPLIAQIWGKKPDNFFKTAQQIADGSLAAEIGLNANINFAGIDLNMGCPDKTVVKNGSCSALINNRQLASEIILATKEGVADRLPVSVKTRLGFSQIDLSWPEFLLNHHLDMLSMHARTRQEMSKVAAHWDLFGPIKELRDKISAGTKLVGNGDIITRQQGLELAEKYNLDGVMIGRGIFQDPFVFALNSQWNDFTKKQRINLFKSHAELFQKTWVATKHPPIILNKFCKIYIQGFDGAKELRQKLMVSRNMNELLDQLNIELI